MHKYRSLIILLLLLPLLVPGCNGSQMTTQVAFVPDPRITLPLAPGSIANARDVLQNRLDASLSGKSEVRVDINALRVSLSKASDLPLAIEMATQTGLLVFFHSDTYLEPGATIPAGTRPVLTGADIRHVQVTQDSSTGMWMILITLIPSGKTTLANYTGSHIGAYLVIARDNQVISCPRVNAAIAGGQATISGFDRKTAQKLAVQINSGALPVPLVVEK